MLDDRTARRVHELSGLIHSPNGFFWSCWQHKEPAYAADGPYQLADEAQEFLDLDLRFWNEDEGAFDYYGERVYFRKERDWVVLEVGTATVEFARP